MTEISSKIDEIFSFPDELTTYPRMEPIFPGCAESKNYKVALVPINIKYPDDFNFQKKGGHQLLELKSSTAKRVKRDIINSSRSATDNGAKLVVFSEFAYPG